MPENDLTDATLFKRGEICAQTRIRRDKSGLRVEVKIHPGVEELFTSWGGGERSAVSEYGRMWIPQKGESLSVHQLYSNPGNVQISKDLYYSFERVGEVLSRKDGNITTVNLSFLRLVGASAGNGVSFHIAGVYSLESLRTLNDQLKTALQRFYQDYLLPVDFYVVMQTQEMKV
jgi:hypothetical protein